MIWILAGVVLAGAVQDFMVLFVSTRRDGRSLGELVKEEMGPTAGVLALVACFMIMVIILAVLAMIVVKALTHSPWGTYTVAFTIPLAIFMGIYIRYLRPGRIGEVSVIGLVMLVFAIVSGGWVAESSTWAPWFDYTGVQLTWILVGYGFIAAVLPVWLLLAPRDYLSTFLKIGTIVGLAIGILIMRPTLTMPALTKFIDGTGPVWSGSMFPFLFITIACGAISGFHSLVGSGTTAKQLNSEKDARPIAYGGMLIECALAIISLCAVGYVWKFYSAGELVVPTNVFATGISKMTSTIPFLKGAESVIFSMLVLAVSAFCLTSLDTATRLARYMFQEFWLEPGEEVKSVTGYKKVLTNPYVATIITVVLGIALGMTGYANVWPLFGAANQLLAALGLLAVATWLGKVGKNNKMFLGSDGFYADCNHYFAVPHN